MWPYLLRPVWTGGMSTAHTNLLKGTCLLFCKTDLKKCEAIPLHRWLNDGLCCWCGWMLCYKHKRFHSVGERQMGVAVSHLEDFEVVLRFFYQLSDGKVHSLSVPEEHERNQRTSAAEQGGSRGEILWGTLQKHYTDCAFCIVLKGVMMFCPYNLKQLQYGLFYISSCSRPELTRNIRNKQDVLLKWPDKQNIYAYTLLLLFYTLLQYHT